MFETTLYINQSSQRLKYFYFFQEKIILSRGKVNFDKSCMQDQRKYQFLRQHGIKSGKRIWNYQFERTPGVPRLLGAAKVTTNLPMS
jgi:hypothetical protein